MYCTLFKENNFEIIFGNANEFLSRFTDALQEIAIMTANRIPARILISVLILNF